MSVHAVYPRFLQARVESALADTPAVLVVGPRRAGKTTLIRDQLGEGRAYVSLDDATALEAARTDPTAFIRGLGVCTIDEVQRAPGLLLAIKQAIDLDAQAGTFLLTGSANLLTLPRIADSLAGRMESIEMLPLARFEIAGKPASILAELFAGRVNPGHKPAVLGEALQKQVLAGGFPEVLKRPTEKRQQDWARAYLKAILARDLRDIADLDNIAQMPKFVRLLAEYSSQLVNYSQVGAGIGISQKTSQRYVALLEQLFLVSTLPPWYTNATKRVIKTPKLHFLDACVLATSRGLTLARLKTHRQAWGPLLQTFVYSEVRKLISATDQPISLTHFRDQDKREVDLVLERADGVMVGLEIKGAATVTERDFRGMRVLAGAHGKQFVFGAVLYDGDRVISFGRQMAAVPLSRLWSS